MAWFNFRFDNDSGISFTSDTYYISPLISESDKYPLTVKGTEFNDPNFWKINPDFWKVNDWNYKITYNDLSIKSPNYKIEKLSEFYLINIIAPFLKKENFDITIEQNKLHIKYEIKKENDNIIYDTISGKYDFYIELDNANFDKVDATYKNNILSIKIPFTKENKIIVK